MANPKGEVDVIFDHQYDGLFTTGKDNTVATSKFNEVDVLALLEAELDAKLDTIEATLAHAAHEWAKVSGVTQATKLTVDGILDTVGLIVGYLRDES